MAGDKLPSTYSLDRPEKLNDLLKKDRVDDCFGCRVVGATAFGGLGAYSYFSGLHHLEQNRAKIIASKSMFGMRSRRFGITGISLGLAFMGFWRLTQ
ncbi:hypothetical protein B0T17DRAFT_498086 [Bombardia bombarda]|uniref:Distal membrane-arm assembly complex protein 1-like domain-containing protein n=1 Tax=Bombardia bombarda TaxID=252184 RepID=A0AA40BVD1_9PEZI|nr:hypothetical protein B0T17DRAFT_498086 [Bombardia bombarda]